MVMMVMIDTQLPLSVLASEVQSVPQVLKNVEVDNKKAAEEDPAVLLQVQACGAELGDTGRVLVRASGTEEVLRVMAEADENEICEKHVNLIIDALRTSGHLIKVREK